MQAEYDNENELLNCYDNEWLIIDGILEECRIDGKEKIEIPDGVIEISSWSFGSKIKYLYIPKTVCIIRECAFNGCWDLEEIYIENPDILLESHCFSRCENLKSVYIGGQKIRVVITDGEYGLGDCRGNCIEKYFGEEDTYKVDDDIKKIGEMAFYNCATLKEVVMSQSVVEIDDRAFANCSALTYIDLPGSLEIIGIHAFEGCDNIREIRIPKSVNKLWHEVFKGWKSYQTIYVPIKFKKVKLLQKWRRGCNATIVYY